MASLVFFGGWGGWREGLGSSSPRIFLLQPPIQGLFLKGPNPHGEGGGLRDDGDVAKVGRVQGVQKSAVPLSSQWQGSQNCGQPWGLERAGR